MAKGSGRGYVSALDIGLSQTPQTTNPDVFNDLLEAYNAIHILNATQDTIVNKIFSPDEDATPDEAMPFIRSIWVHAAEAIDIGNCVRPASGGSTFRKGHMTSITGLALTAATPTTEDPNPMFKIGFGPAIFKIDDLTAGTYMWTTDGGDSLADPYRGQLIQSNKLKNSCIVGRCIMNGYLIFCPGWFNTK